MNNEEPYKEMYLHLFRQVTKAIDMSNESTVRRLLKKAQINCEDIFISFEDEEPNDE